MVSLSLRPRPLAAADRTAAPSRWGPRAAWPAGAALLALEAAQSVAVIPLLVRWMPAQEVAFWVALVAGTGLANAACAAYAQPLVRRIAARGEAAAPVANWRELRARTARLGAALLLLLQAGFVLALATRRDTWPPDAGWALALFALALHLRLAALNEFVLLNGLRQVGRDKWMLVRAGAAGIAGLILAAAFTHSAAGLALASLGAATLLWAMARRAASQSSAAAQPAAMTLAMAAAWPSRREMAALFLLNLSGFMNVATDVLVARQFLAPADVAAFAFWSRLLLAATWLVGLHAQIRFPYWAGDPTEPLLPGRGRVVALGLMAALALAPLAYAASRDACTTMCTLPPWLVAVMAANVAALCASMLLGQWLTARGTHAFVPPAIACACAAPLLALAAPRLFGDPHAFMAGYLSANLVLLAVLARLALRLRETRR